MSKRIHNQAENSEVANPNSFSGQTLINGIKELGFKQKIQQKSIEISEEYKMKRVKWAKSLLHDKKKILQSCIYGDDIFIIFQKQSKTRIQVNDELDSIPTQKQTRWTEKVMIWGAINKNGPLYISFLQGNLNQEKYLEMLQEFKSDMENKDEEITYFQQDNARPHQGNLIYKFFDDNDITALPWASQRPDVNPIERIWSLLKWKQRIRQFRGL